MDKLLILVRTKEILEQDVIIIKVYTGHIYKNLIYHNNALMNIMSNAVIMQLMVDNFHYFKNMKHTRN